MEELTVQGIILRAAPQGEHGRRLSLLTDSFGRITVFASGGAKASSKLIGALRPFTAGSFVLAKGRTAYNIRGIEVMNNFEEISLDPEIYIYGAYVLEAGEFFSREGMERADAVELLNLMYMTLSELSRLRSPEAAGSARNGGTVKEGRYPDGCVESRMTPAFLCRIYELRLLEIEGEYTEEPELKEAGKLWNHVLRAPLSRLYELPKLSEKETEAFAISAGRLFSRQTDHSFKTLKILREL